jgi:hypothetical protein
MSRFSSRLGRTCCSSRTITRAKHTSRHKLCKVKYCTSTWGVRIDRGSLFLTNSESTNSWRNWRWKFIGLYMSNVLVVDDSAWGDYIRVFDHADDLTCHQAIENTITCGNEKTSELFWLFCEIRLSNEEKTLFSTSEIDPANNESLRNRIDDSFARHLARPDFWLMWLLRIQDGECMSTNEIAYLWTDTVEWNIYDIAWNNPFKAFPIDELGKSISPRIRNNLCFVSTMIQFIQDELQ